jgi:hypothetical protein
MRLHQKSALVALLCGAAVLAIYCSAPAGRPADHPESIGTEPPRQTDSLARTDLPSPAVDRAPATPDRAPAPFEAEPHPTRALEIRVVDETTGEPLRFAPIRWLDSSARSRERIAQAMNEFSVEDRESLGLSPLRLLSRLGFAARTNDDGFVSLGVDGPAAQVGYLMDNRSAFEIVDADGVLHVLRVRTGASLDIRLASTVSQQIDSVGLYLLWRENPDGNAVWRSFLGASTAGRLVVTDVDGIYRFHQQRHPAHYPAAIVPAIPGAACSRELSHNQTGLVEVRLEVPEYSPARVHLTDPAGHIVSTFNGKVALSDATGLPWIHRFKDGVCEIPSLAVGSLLQAQCLDRSGQIVFNGALGPFLGAGSTIRLESEVHAAVIARIESEDDSIADGDVVQIHPDIGDPTSAQVRGGEIAFSVEREAQRLVVQKNRLTASARLPDQRSSVVRLGPLFLGAPRDRLIVRAIDSAGRSTNADISVDSEFGVIDPESPQEDFAGSVFSYSADVLSDDLKVTASTHDGRTGTRRVPARAGTHVVDVRVSEARSLHVRVALPDGVDAGSLWLGLRSAQDQFLPHALDGSNPESSALERTWLGLEDAHHEVVVGRHRPYAILDVIPVSAPSTGTATLVIDRSSAPWRDMRVTIRPLERAEGLHLAVMEVPIQCTPIGNDVVITVTPGDTLMFFGKRCLGVEQRIGSGETPHLEIEMPDRPKLTLLDGIAPGELRLRCDDPLLRAEARWNVLRVQPDGVPRAIDIPLSDIVGESRNSVAFPRLYRVESPPDVRPRLVDGSWAEIIVRRD